MHNEKEHAEEGKLHQNNRKWLYIGLGIAGVLGIIVIAIVFAGGVNMLGSPVCQQVPYQEQEPYTKTEYYTETVPYTDQECEDKKLGYSVTDFTLVSNTCNKKVEECTDYTLGFCTSKIKYCVDRTVTCSLKLNNLDMEVSGLWKVRMDFMKSGSSNVADSDNSNLAVYPSDSNYYSFSGKITTKELYEQGYTCQYSVLSAATKPVCRDVIKYKEVEKSREVTAYQPVTKYKEVCN